MEPSLSSLIASAERGDRSAVDVLFATCTRSWTGLSERMVQRQSEKARIYLHGAIGSAEPAV